MAARQELPTMVAGRLADTSSGELRVFAVGVAERLLRQHERLPGSERAPYTSSQRPLLDSLWAGVLGDLTAFTVSILMGVSVERRLLEFAPMRDAPAEQVAELLRPVFDALARVR